MTDILSISFPGVQYPLAASYALSHGISPSVATLEMVPQYGGSQVQQSGNLVISSGSGAVVIRDMRIDSASTRFDPQGQRIIILRLLDRRWKWKFGTIGGRYNIRRPDNTIDEDTKKTPQELAELLLDAMGESGYQVGDLPNNIYPSVEWTADNPAEELEELAEAFGCRVVLQLDNTVALRRLGQGSTLPGGPQLTDAFGFNPPDKPSSMTFVSGPVRFQQRLELEAVGEDTNGEIKLIDDLSYAPTNGWSKETPYSLISAETDRDKRALAAKSVFKWYRIKDDVSPPEYPEIKKRKDILPIDDFLVDTETDSDGREVPRKAYVYGTFWEAEPGQTENSTNVQCKKIFSIDRDRGIVQFDEFVVKFKNGPGEVEPATLYLVCSYTGRDSESREIVRWSKKLPVNGGTPGTGTEPVRRDDVVPTVKELYDSSFNVAGSENNLQSDIEPEAQYHLDAALMKYQDLQTDEREYPGIIPVNCDGAIHQVSWSIRVGEGGKATTQASRNTEHSLKVPPYESRRQRQRAMAVTTMKNAIKASVVSAVTGGGVFGGKSP